MYDQNNLNQKKDTWHFEVISVTHSANSSFIVTFLALYFCPSKNWSHFGEKTYILIAN